MFFGGLFATYIIYRALYLTAFEEGSRLLNVKFGATNTAVLIGSSLTMALAIHAAQAGKKKSEQVMYLVLTMILGALFLFLKFNYEWRADYHEHLIPGFGFIIRPEWGAAGPHVPLFFCFYFFMTGLHATAHDHRLRHPRNAHADGAPQPVQSRILRAARSQRPVLALRRYRLDFPVSAAVSDRRQVCVTGGALMSGHVVPVKTYLGIFVALLVLTALTTGVAYVDFGDMHTGIRLIEVIPLNTVVALAIAVVKMLLVILFFMHVKYSSGLTEDCRDDGISVPRDSGVLHSGRRTHPRLDARSRRLEHRASHDSSPTSGPLLTSNAVQRGTRPRRSTRRTQKNSTAPLRRALPAADSECNPGRTPDRAR